MLNTVSDITEKVFLKRPVLRTILDKYGQQTLWEYSKSFSALNAKVSTQRKNEFILTLASQVSGVLGRECGESAARQLYNNYFVSTADHFGLLSHPFFLHTNMLAGLSGFSGENLGLTDWIVLACSNVSLNNSSFPRGMQFHIQKNGELKQAGFPFFSAALGHSPVYKLPAYTSGTVEKFRQFLHYQLPSSVDKESVENVAGLYGHTDVLGLSYYTDQAALANYRVFKYFFPDASRALNLIYVNQEQLTIDLLKHHLNTNTDIHKLLFDPQYRKASLDLFDGIPGAFSLKESRGSFLFWGNDIAKSVRIRLTEKNGAFVSSHGRFAVDIDPQSINNALSNGTLIPSLLLNMLVVGGYYGVKCLGGFSQTSYLTWMLEGYKKMFPDSEVGDSQTLCGDFIFADIALGNKQAFAATGLDMLLYKKQFDPQSFKEFCKTKTLIEVIGRVMPTLFKILYPSESEYHWPEQAYLPDFSISPAHAYPVIKL